MYGNNLKYSIKGLRQPRKFKDGMACVLLEWFLQTLATKYVYIMCQDNKIKSIKLHVIIL